ncbi:MAG: MATE family efflux transporter [Alphaproteobacteria bacterium]|nr:MATE family efflux transporter [Alphaproteobacteria bacterium]
MDAANAPLLRLPPGRAILSVAWPMVALGWVRSLYLVADAWWVGRLGSDALTALSVTSFAWWILNQCGELAATGVHALSAQAEGGGRRSSLGALAGHGVLVGLVVWAAVAASSPWWSRAYLAAMDLPQGVVHDLSAPFLVVSAVSAVGLGMQAVVAAVFRGLGQTRWALGMTVVGLVLNTALDPWFIWGGGPLAAMGLAGAAWATGLSALVSAVVGAVVLAREGMVLVLAPGAVRAARRIVAIGGPITVMGIGFSLVYVILGRLITSLGVHHMAALGVGHRLESFTYLASVGFSVAAATMVGQHLGAGDVSGAREAARTAARWCTVVMLVGGALGWVAAEPLYRAFSDDPRIIEAGVVYYRFQCAVWVFMGFEVVYEGAFTGAGHTRPPLWISGTLTAARLPMAWAFAVGLGLGIDGVWAAVALSTLLKGVVLRAWWARDTWVATGLRLAEDPG